MIWTYSVEGINSFVCTSKEKEAVLILSTWSHDMFEKSRHVLQSIYCEKKGEICSFSIINIWVKTSALILQYLCSWAPFYLYIVKNHCNFLPVGTTILLLRYHGFCYRVKSTISVKSPYIVETWEIWHWSFLVQASLFGLSLCGEIGVGGGMGVLGSYYLLEFSFYFFSWFTWSQETNNYEYYFCFYIL